VQFETKGMRFYWIFGAFSGAALGFAIAAVALATEARTLRLAEILAGFAFFIVVCSFLGGAGGYLGSLWARKHIGVAELAVIGASLLAMLWALWFGKLGLPVIAVTLCVGVPALVVLATKKDREGG